CHRLGRKTPDRVVSHDLHPGDYLLNGIKTLQVRSQTDHDTSWAAPTGRALQLRKLHYWQVNLSFGCATQIDDSRSEPLRKPFFISAEKGPRALLGPRALRCAVRGQRMAETARPRRRRRVRLAS